MKFIVCTLALVALASAVPVVPLTRDGLARIDSQVNEQNVDGSFNYSYGTENGIVLGAKGLLVPSAPNGEPAPEVEGGWEYTAPNGELVKTSYVSGQNGYQPQGTHIHPVPESVLRSLEWNAAHPEEEAYWDAVYAKQQPHSYYPVGLVGPAGAQ